MRVLAWLLVMAAGLGAADAIWTPATSMQVRKIDAVTPSPDGKMAVWAQTVAVMEAEKSENLTHLYLWRSGGKGPVQLTRGEKGAQSPAFAPDGKSLFFVSARSGKANLYRLPLDGGEAEMVTDLKGTLGLYQVSPDGKWVAFTALEPDAEAEKAKKEKRDVNVVDEKPANHALFVIPVEADGAGKRVAKKLAGGDVHVVGMDWAPDSRVIAFDHWPRNEFNLFRRGDISEVELESGTVRELARTAANETQARYSPDGRFVAFVQSTNAAVSTGGNRVALLDRKSKTVRLLAATPDEGPQLVGWAADGTRVYVSEPYRTRSAVYAIPVDGPRQVVQQTAKGTARLYPAMSKDGWVGATMENAAEPVEAYLLHLGTQKLVKVSAANGQLPRLALGMTEVRKWMSRDKVEVEGLLTYPVGYEKGKRYPLAVVIHGGPAGVFSESFIGNSGVTSIAAFAAKGYAVLRVNPRGSVGYGTAFRQANKTDWGGGDYQDIMAGVDLLIREGIADEGRMAVMGWSYGGYMTSWVISQTTRFKAAIVGAGITNVWSMWGTNDIPSVLDEYFDGPPWKQADLYRERSGLYHAAKVKTPTLFLHGEADLRVPIGQAYEYYHALKALGVTTKMVAYPRTPHGPNEPKFVQDVMERHLEWVERYAR